MIENLHSSTRRHSLRNVSGTRIDSPRPRTPKSNNPMQSATGLADLNSSHSDSARKSKSRTAKPDPHKPSKTLPPPIIYDMIEVMLGPPPELLEVEQHEQSLSAGDPVPKPTSTKRKSKKSPSRRSKRLKLDSLVMSGLFASNSGSPGPRDSDLHVHNDKRPLELVSQNAESASTEIKKLQDYILHPEGPSKDTSVPPEKFHGIIQLPHNGGDGAAADEIEQINSEAMEYARYGGSTEFHQHLKENVPGIMPDDASPTHPTESTRLPFSDGEKPREPTEDVDDWLMTDIDQSMEDESIAEQVESVGPEIIRKSKVTPGVCNHLSESQSTEKPATLKDNQNNGEEKREFEISPLQNMPSREGEEYPRPALKDDLHSEEQEDRNESQSTRSPERDGMPNNAEDESDEAVVLVRHESPLFRTETITDQKSPKDETPKLDPQIDPIAAIIDEARINLSDSGIESPSPPLRSVLPKSFSRTGRSISSSKSPEASRQIEESRAPPIDANKILEDAEEAARSPLPERHETTSPTTRPCSSHAAMDYPTVARSSSVTLQLPTARKRRRVSSMKNQISSTENSRMSTPVSTPISQSASPSAVSRPHSLTLESPSFGLRTIPRPVGPPPSRPSSGGLRHVNQDGDMRSKIMMARPKTAIPSHIDARDYARECLEAAASSRLPPYSLDPAEHKLLREHINHVQVTTYLNIRNGILRLWLLNPTIAVSQEEALGVAKDGRHWDLAAKCYEFLVRGGHINFGCIQIPQAVQRPGSSSIRKPSLQKKRQKRVVVIGAGAAGLGCARQLQSLFAQFSNRFPSDEGPPEVVVLEGRDRIGGRIHSLPLEQESISNRPGSSSSSRSRRSMDNVKTIPTPIVGQIQNMAVDLGAQIVTGFDYGNPLAVILRRQVGLRWKYLSDNSLLYDDESGARLDAKDDIRVERLFNEILDRVSSFRAKRKDSPLIEGDRDLMEQGKEPHNNSGRTIAKVEQNEAILPPMPPSPPLSIRHGSSDRSTKSSTRPNLPERLPSRRTLVRMGFKLRNDKTSPREHDHLCWNQNTLGETMRSVLLGVQDLTELIPLDLKLLNWHWANLEYGNATTLDNLSLMHWDQDDGNEFLGAHAMVIGGYGQFANSLASNPSPLNIRYNHCVEKITYSQNGGRATPEIEDMPITITCNNGDTIHADAVVVTVSLGVLKSRSISFEPELPDYKKEAISRLGFGLLNKVILVFEEEFWNPDVDFFGCLRTPAGDLSSQDSYTHIRGRFYLIWNCTVSCGRPTLVALMAGEAALQVEEESDEALATEMMSLLSRIHDKHPLPTPVQTIVTRWQQDQFAKGSYSFVGPKATGEDYDTLGKPVNNVLFFAGEATCRTHPATVHGAYMSGLRAASEVLEAFIGKIEMPSTDELLIPKRNEPTRNPLIQRTSTISRVPRRTDPESRRYKARDIKKAKFQDIVEDCNKIILERLGPKPVPPKKCYQNAFLLFQKDKWDIAKQKAKEAKSGNMDGERASRDEVRAFMGKMWRELPDAKKEWYNKRVEKEKVQYKKDIATFEPRLQAWEQGVTAIKEQMKNEFQLINLNDEEKRLIEAAWEEERLEIAARQEKESFRKFYGEVGIDPCLSSDNEEDNNQDLYLQSDEVIINQLLQRVG